MTEQNLNLVQDCFVYPMNQKKRSGPCACVVVVQHACTGLHSFLQIIFSSKIEVEGLKVEWEMGNGKWEMGEVWQSINWHHMLCTVHL